MPPGNGRSILQHAHQSIDHTYPCNVHVEKRRTATLINLLYPGYGQLVVAAA